MKKPKTIYNERFYMHFDNPIKCIDGILQQKYINNIENKSWVVKHGFFPFVKYIKTTHKYKNNKSIPPKNRSIMYCSHIDRYIYQYYESLLNELYNKKMISLDINNVATAYRDNMEGMSNIQFSKEVFDFIKKHDICIIYVTDFKKYFDNIDHTLLKNKIESVLDVNRLPNDYYKVFCSVTKYCYVTNEDIVKHHQIDNPELKLNTYTEYNKFKSLKNQKKFFTNKEFKEFKKNTALNINPNTFGIPQGSPISSVLSNIYLLDFDSNLSTFAKTKYGLYRRYCDDLIIVIPLIDSSSKSTSLKEIENTINFNIKSIPNLELSLEKTNIFLYNNATIYNLDIHGQTLNENLFLEYLGFIFDGKCVKIREKSITNYYRKLYKRMNIINKYSKRYNKAVYRRKFYKQFSHLGSNEIKNDFKNENHFGNFLTYAYRSHTVFKEYSAIQDQIKNHWAIIQKGLIP